MSKDISKIKFICKILKIGIEEDETFDSMFNKVFLTSVALDEMKSSKDECYREKLKRKILDENELKELVKKYGNDDLETSISSRVYCELSNSRRFLKYVNRKAEREYLEKLREVKELVEEYGDDDLKMRISTRVHNEFNIRFFENTNCKIEKEYLEELRKIAYGDKKESKRKNKNDENNKDTKKLKTELDSDFDSDSDDE